MQTAFYLAILSLLTGIVLPAPAQTTQPVTRVKLWPQTPGLVAGRDTDTDPTDPTMDIYLSPGGSAAKSAVIIFPGGGYTHLSTLREGSDIAHMLLGHHITAFVVRYRHAPRYQYPIPMLDAARAIRTVRYKAADFGIDPNKIGVIGFSAGGHLAATLATQFDSGNPAAPDPIDRVSSRPDFAILMYPVITFDDERLVHKGSRQALVGNRTELFAALSADQHVTPQTPPIFLAHASPDPVVPVENSILFYMACHKNKVPAEMHLFQSGGHGFALAATDPALSVWPQLLMTWMARNHWAAPAELHH